MKWREFTAYMSGLDGKTPLGRIVSIRAEEDREVLKQFTPEQKKIRSEWRLRKAKKMPKQDVAAVIEQFKNMFISMAGITAKADAEEVQDAASGKDAQAGLP
jgi:flagellar motor switch protein FliG